MLDPTDFVARYLSFGNPCAANLGPEGAILCHVLYAWAVSYGVDEHGRLDIPEGGGTSGMPISLLEPGKDEIKREEDRQTRFSKMRLAVEVILQEIDACGILRKPTWDGVRVLLLLLPLTEGSLTGFILEVRTKLNKQEYHPRSNGWPCTKAHCPKYLCSVHTGPWDTMGKQLGHRV